jgi:hypothetical protein
MYIYIMFLCDSPYAAWGWYIQPFLEAMPSQADGTEYRLPGDGHWPSFNVSPGDLVVSFRHKARPGEVQLLSLGNHRK